MLNQLEGSYRKAPFFKTAFPVVTSILQAERRNLFEYIYQSIQKLADFLQVKTPLVISSSIGIDHSLRGEDKVLAICRTMRATDYVNAIGGLELYSKANFLAHRISLEFIKTRPIRYQQYGGAFVENLSIVDVMMFNSRETISGFLRDYDLV